MKRFISLCAFVALCFAFVGCYAGDEGAYDQVEQAAAGGKWCMSSYDCGEGFFCTTEEGDCLTPPVCEQQNCLTVCYGRCARTEVCGDKVCAPGLVCCNESCGICTEPGGYCTEQYCLPQ